MSTLPSTAALIRQHIETLPPGEPFSPASLAALGTRAAIDQSLSRLAKAGFIARVARGVFVRPEYSRFVGNVLPAPAKVAAALVKTTGALVQVHGAEAARQLGLSTQVPTQPVFNTSGPSRRVRMGNLEIRLQHVSARKLALADRPAGLAVAALWYLGKAQVTNAVIATIRRKLPSAEFALLKTAQAHLPGWMRDVLYRSEQAEPHG